MAACGQTAHLVNLLFREFDGEEEAESIETQAGIKCYKVEKIKKESLECERT